MPWVALTFVLIGLATVPVYRWRAGRTSPGHALSWTLRDGAVVASLVTVLAFTVRPGLGIDGGSVMVNFVPFRDLVHSLDLSPFYQRLALGNLVGNILLFVPWGAALALRYRALGVLAVLGICAGSSTGIEVWQGISATGRNVDITDVLMNTVGGVLGFVAVRTLWSHPTDRIGPATTRSRPG